MGHHGQFSGSKITAFISGVLEIVFRNQFLSFVLPGPRDGGKGRTGV